MPPPAAQLCTMLPPPDCFRGPFVNVDLMIDVFNQILMPEHGNLNFSNSKFYEILNFNAHFINVNENVFVTAPLPTADNGCDTKLFDLAKSVHWIVDETNDGISIASRRKRSRLAGDDSDDEDLPPPPINDLYRQRQQKRVKP